MTFTEYFSLNFINMSTICKIKSNNVSKVSTEVEFKKLANISNSIIK